MADGKFFLNYGFGNIAIDPDAFVELATEADAAVWTTWKHKRTTTATPGVLLGLPLLLGEDPGIWSVTVKVLAHKTDGTKAGFWHKGMVAKQDAASATTVVGAEYDVAPEQGASGYTVSLSLSGGQININVTGAAGETVDWFGQVDLLQLSAIT